MTIQKMDLHASVHHSLHLDIDGDTASRLIYRMSMQHYRDTTGKPPPQRVDKTKVKIIDLKDDR